MNDLTTTQKHILDLFINELVSGKDEFKERDYNENIEFYELMVYAYRNTEAILKTENKP